MLSLCLSSVLADVDRGQFFLTKATGGFTREITNVDTDVTDYMQAVVVDSANTASLGDIEANLLGEGPLLNFGGGQTNPQVGQILVFDLDVNANADLQYDGVYSFCVLQKDAANDPFAAAICDDAPPLTWGDFDLDRLRKGHEDFRLNYQIASEADAADNGPLYYVVLRTDDDLSVDDVVAGANTLADNNEEEVDDTDLDDDFKVTLLHDVPDLDFNETVYVSTVLNTPHGRSNVLKKEFFVDDHDWGWEVAVIIGVIVGVCCFVAILAAIAVLLSGLIKECC